MPKHPYRGPKEINNKVETNLEGTEMTDLSKDSKLEKDVSAQIAEKKLQKQVEKELLSVSKEETIQTKKELSREEKKAARRAGMSEHGRLTVPEGIKEVGYRYRVCNVLPGNIENWKSKGYEVVTHDMKSGDGSNSRPEVNGVPCEFEVGGANGSMKAVWMRITEEDASILDEIRDEDNRNQDQMVKDCRNPLNGESFIPNANLIGSVSKETK